MLGTLILCGGDGLFENMDIVECELVTELESLDHGPGDCDVDVTADSLANIACCGRGLPVWYV